jgi:hypothetical protein
VGSTPTIATNQTEKVHVMGIPILPTQIVTCRAETSTLDSKAQNAIVAVDFPTAARVVIPAKTVVNFPVGSTFQVVQTGEGEVTVSCADVIVGTVATAAVGQMIFCTKTAPTVWHSALAA